jgi:hypothetical protein
MPVKARKQKAVRACGRLFVFRNSVEAPQHNCADLFTAAYQNQNCCLAANSFAHV